MPTREKEIILRLPNLVIFSPK